MKAIMKHLGFLIAVLLLAGCGGGGSGTVTPPAAQPGALETGGAGLPITQIDNGTGTAVTPNFSAAVAINDDAIVVGMAEITAGATFVASLWTVNPTGAASVAPTALNPLVLGGFASAFAIDAAGTVVGQAFDGTNQVATIWPTATTPAALPALTDGLGTSAAYAISTDGTLAIGEAVDATGTTRAVIWTTTTPGVFTTLAATLPINTFATGAGPSLFSSASGVARVSPTEILVVGEAENGDGVIHAALWRSINGGTNFTAIDLGADLIAYAVNGARQVAGENNSTLSPVSWTIDDQGVAAAPVSLEASGTASAINTNGRIAGSSGTPNVATVWSGTTPTALYSTEGQAYGLNNEDQPLVVGRNGSAGFVKRAN